MLVVVTAFGVWMGWELEIVRKRQNMRRFLEAACGSDFKPYNTAVSTNGGGISVVTFCSLSRIDCQIPWVRRILGDESVEVMCLPASVTPERVAEFKRTFPEASISQMDRRIPLPLKR